MRMHKICLCVLASICMASVLRANTVITLANSAGTPDAIFSDVATSTGATIALNGAMTVTVFFSDGSNTGPLAWVTNVGTCTSAGSCGQATGAVGNGVWTLTESFNTGTIANTLSPDTSAQNPWTLTNTSSTVGIASITLNGVVSAIKGTIFDRDFFGAPPGATSVGQEGTPFGSSGIDFTFDAETGGSSPYTVTVQYSNIVTLVGAAQPCLGANWSQGGTNTTATGCGDSFGTVSFAFSAPFVATTTVTPTTWVFFQDTDAVAAPEPVTFGFTAIALLAVGVGVYRKRRSRIV